MKQQTSYAIRNKKTLTLMTSSLQILKARPGIKCPSCDKITHLDPSEGLQALAQYKSNNTLQILIEKYDFEFFLTPQIKERGARTVPIL
jgi:hypothetical protein